jgi:RNA polymerase sigma factor (sigma-70 family)
MLHSDSTVPITVLANGQGPDDTGRMADVAQLRERLSDGDPVAFERLVELYLDPLARYVHRYVQSWDDTKTLVRGVFREVWERRRDLGMLRDLDDFLYTVARQHALYSLTQHRAARSQGSKRPYSTPTLIEGGPIVPADAAQPAASGEVGAAIQRAVDTLSAQAREALRLRGQDRSDEAIAAALGIEPTAVESLVQSAVEHLVAVLQRDSS